MCQTSDLRIKSQSGLTLLLGDFHLTFFILSDILHSYPLAERIKHIVLCFMYHSGNITNTFLDSRGLCLCLSTTEASVKMVFFLNSRWKTNLFELWCVQLAIMLKLSQLFFNAIKAQLASRLSTKLTIRSELTKVTIHTRSSRETVSVDSKREISAKRFSSVFIRGLCLPSSFN